MTERKVYLLDGRVIVSEFDSQINIISKPYRNLKYLFIFLLYIVGSILFTYCIFNFEKIVATVLTAGDISILILILFGNFLLVTAGFPFFIFFIFKYTFIQNLFLKEELILKRDGLIYKRYDRELLNIRYSLIQNVNFYPNKEYKGFFGDSILLLMPNYEPIIQLSISNQTKKPKIFESIKKSEIESIYKLFTEVLITNNLLFDENHSYGSGYLKINFKKADEFYLKSKYLFEKKDIENIDNDISVLKNKNDKYYSLVIQKFKENNIDLRRHYPIKF